MVDYLVPVYKISYTSELSQETIIPTTN